MISGVLPTSFRLPHAAQSARLPRSSRPGHRRVASSLLVRKTTSLLFTTAGVQFRTLHLSGQTRLPAGTTSQNCVRFAQSQRPRQRRFTARHHTVSRCWGPSLGDYFKADAIALAGSSSHGRCRSTPPAWVTVLIAIGPGLVRRGVLAVPAGVSRERSSSRTRTTWAMRPGPAAGRISTSQPTTSLREEKAARVWAWRRRDRWLGLEPGLHAVKRKRRTRLDAPARSIDTAAL